MSSSFLPPKSSSFASCFVTISCWIPSSSFPFLLTQDPPLPVAWVRPSPSPWLLICHQTVLTTATPKHCNTSLNSNSFISLNHGFFMSSSYGIDTLIRTVSFCCRIETFTQRSEILTVTVYLKSQRDIRTSSLWRSKLYIVTGTKQTLAVPILLFCV